MNNQKGLTLLETSVALTIIALILGAVYRGNEILNQAKLGSVIKELYKFQTAVNLFRVQYNALPGDYSAAANMWPSASTSSGNGNNYIESASTTSSIVGTSTNSPLEDTYVFQHLYLAGILQEYYIGGVISGSRKIIGKNLPISKFATGTYELFTENLYNQTATYLEFGSLSPSNSQFAYGPILTSADANYIDKKIDDGLASSGVIFASNSTTVSGCTDNNFSSSSGTYILTSNIVACRLAMILPAVN